MIYIVLYSLARATAIQIWNRGSFVIVIRLRLHSSWLVLYVRFPANEARMHSFAFLPLAIVDAENPLRKVDMICTLLYSFPKPSGSNFKTGDRVCVCHFVCVFTGAG